ncbi:MAG: tryptophan--tRNA ligase [Ruminococcaceae bacterium]|nr:tryptophan--tRNA ligase [Oscillospiraceae bacterium]MEE1198373.1 tryptophan--tRNA ligase [Acutalibacteraceae bacterium]
MEENRKKVLSCIQPSGMLTLGNYIGALKNWVAMQNEFDCTYAVADLHAITVRQEPAKFRQQIYSTAALLLALGIDPEKNTMFIQSHVAAHSELAWILSCYTQFGELSRMTQFKDKSAKHADNVNVGLFSYPVLMAADILLYQSDLVPVGADQKQHLEIARDIATRFNHVYGDVFTIPEPYIPKIGARVMSLQDPTKKMSKSDENINSWVAILDSKDDIIRKFKRAVTDSDNRICVSEDKPGVSNLIGIYSAVTGKSAEQVTAEFEGKGYGDFKIAVGEAVAEELKPIQERYQTFISDKKQLEDIYRQGDEKAFYAARKTLSKVKKKVGFVL